MRNGDCLHVVLFGTFVENRYFLECYKDSFDLIGFNANIIAHAPAGIAGFISQLKNKCYFIDPQTHAFQQGLSTIMRKKDGKLELKQSISKLAEFYGSIINEQVGKEPIRPNSLSSKYTEEICRNVLNFEATIIEKSINEEIREFLDYSGEFSAKSIVPQFLIAPYFYIEADDLDAELKANADFITSAAEIVGENYVEYSNLLFAEIVLSQEVLFDAVKLDKVINAYSRCNASGFIIWIDEFAEAKVDISESALKSFKKLLAGLTQKGDKPIINLHGSFFSIILSSPEFKMLAGVGHGIEYGEDRPVIPVGGGVPRAKFYFPRFHKRVSYSPDAEDILLETGWTKDKQTYLKNVCDCATCKEIITSNVVVGFHVYGESKIGAKDGKAYPTAEAMNKSRRHYLFTKIDEYKFCANSSRSQILENLSNEIKLSHNIASHSFSHLEKWHKVLAEG